MTIEAMKQALEALEELHRTGDTQVFDMCYAPKAIPALRQAIDQAEKQEPVAWKNAAIRLGEELSSIGPDGYYDMTAEQWLDWAMDQLPRGKNSLPAAQREWVGLTEIEICDIEADELTSASSETFAFARAIEAKLKEKNT